MMEEATMSQCYSSYSLSRLQYGVQMSRKSFPRMLFYLPYVGDAVGVIWRKTLMAYDRKILFYLILMLLQTTGASGMNVYEVIVPNPAIVGQSATLQCVWSSVKDVYSVRWYFKDTQFYSYITGKDEEKIDHKIKGIMIDMENSNDKQVILKTVTLGSEGEYKCELMGEAPYFQSAFKIASLSVVKVPSEPLLSGFQMTYRVGEWLNVNCTVKDSYPKAEIFFFVNGKRVHQESGRVTDLGVVESPRDKLFTTKSQLRMPLSTKQQPRLALTCRAKVLSLQQETTLTADVRPPLSFLGNFGGGCGHCSPAPVFVLLFPALMVLSTFSC